MRQAAVVLEVLDDVFDLGVGAVPGVSGQGGGADDVGDEGVVAPVGQQLGVLTGLGGFGVDPSHDQPHRLGVALEGGHTDFGDFGDAPVVGRTLPQSGGEHLVVAVADGHDRVVAAFAVPDDLPRALFGQPVGPAVGGVQVDGDRLGC